MAGFSIFMNEVLSQSDHEYLKQMKLHNFKGVFTSMHIPEDDASQYHERLLALAKTTKSLGLKLMIDISNDALEQAGFSLQNLKALRSIGVTGLRMDYGISMQKIAEISHEMTVSLNASTLTSDEITELQNADADFKNLEAWHNYYPRPETGLGREWFEQKNNQLKHWGFKVVAFVAGDANLRGPLYQGLPTLEEHRYQNPLAAELDLLQLGVDEVYVGDGGLSNKTQEQHQEYYQNRIVVLHAKKFDMSSEVHKLVFQTHEQRQDVARDVIRSEEAREQCDFVVEPRKKQKRSYGSITLDNQLYGRYMGELQIIKNELSADEKVNVVAEICSKDRGLLRWIEPGQKFRIEDGE